MMLRVPADAFAWFQKHPMVWWSAQARELFGRVAPGIPAIELGEKEEPTGWLLMHHPGIDHRDLYIMEVCLAGMQYVSSLPEKEAAALVAFQAERDYKALVELVAARDAGKISNADAVERIWQEALRQGAIFGVKYVPPVVEDELL